MEYIFYSIVVLLAVILLFSSKSVTVYEYQKGLKYRRGRLVKVLGPNQYIYNRLFSSIQLLDVRPQWLQVPGQEVLCAENVPVKVSLTTKFRITEPEKAVAQANWHTELYTVLQLALRERIAGLSLEEILRGGGQLGEETILQVRDKAAASGLEILEVSIKDVMLPADLKRSYSQVLKARQDGLAALEKARGETAALRNLANAAKLVEESPALFKLRLLQTMGESGGHSLMLNPNKE